MTKADFEILNKQVKELQDTIRVIINKENDGSWISFLSHLRVKVSNVREFISAFRPKS